MLIAAASSLLCFPENPTGFSANPWLFCSANPAAMQQYFRQMSARQPYFCHMSAFTWKYFVRFYSEYFHCKTSPHFRRFKSWLEQRSEDEEILIFAPELFPAKILKARKYSDMLTPTSTICPWKTARLPNVSSLLFHNTPHGAPMPHVHDMHSGSTLSNYLLRVVQYEQCSLNMHNHIECLFYSIMHA